MILASCTKREKKSLNISAGLATHTLKEFARQARVEIIFDPQSVSGIRTKEIRGDYDPQSALRIMLEGTPLSVDFDDETGAYAIIRLELSFLFHRIPIVDTNQGAAFLSLSIKS